MKLQINIEELDWKKVDGMMPAIVQDYMSRQVLMLGYMSREALEKTLQTGKITFFSRTRKSLWTKGETSGNFLGLKSIFIDCDKDTLLVLADPIGPTCHMGTVSCFEGDTIPATSFLNELAALIHDRNITRPKDSYTTSLFEAGKSRVAQKVGEEGVELALAHMEGEKEHIVNEAADLIYHSIVLLEHAGIPFEDVCQTLKNRHTKK
ncbi:MAG: bifunctional phosphoribosyl-AMP cyclohydrolase/phosphoribosyl-ATP diphosphatase HisIE [Alphaproteobacteria bacterium]|nr:bifunctional phosphoribosyl-AMP cyclohydrolase/phosphoribosyl-ATP diphosphatase HisIE [Alphaproteobacteria bacterium]